MGCGSSKSGVAVINSDNAAKSVVSVKNSSEKSSPIVQNNDDGVSATTNEKENVNSEPDTNSSIIQVKNAAGDDDVSVLTDLGSKNSIRGGSKTKINNSIQSMRSSKSREKSAASTRSKDSGVFDEMERINSGKSQRSLPPLVNSGEAGSVNSERIDSGRSLCSNSELVSAKPPSGKKSSARRKLLRLDDDTIDTELSINQPDSGPPEDDIELLSGQNMTIRPKSRFGNLAFDILLDTPETGNAKKRPEKLPALVATRRPKKVKTRKDIDKKMEEAAARRKIQEEEKLLKAKQFQHFSVCTPVEVFKPDEDEEEQTTHVRRIHSIDRDSSLDDPVPPNTNNENRNVKDSFDFTRVKEDERKETLVESFRIDSDDEDSLNDNTYHEKVTLPALVAC